MDVLYILCFGVFLKFPIVSFFKKCSVAQVVDDSHDGIER